MILILILAISLQKAKQWTVSWVEIGSFDRIRMLMTMTKLDIAGLYEVRLAKENPNAGQVQYRYRGKCSTFECDCVLIHLCRAEDLFRFIDTYKEFVALVFDPNGLVSIDERIVISSSSIIIVQL